MYALYAPEISEVCQNLLGSHDTARFLHEAGERPEALRLATVLQMTVPGAPGLYYGDEVGMWGADDPTNRKPMLWKDLEPYDAGHENHVMEDHLEYFRSVIALRRDHVALRRGSIRTVYADDETDVWVFLRETEEERMLVAINASDTYQVVRVPDEIGTSWLHVFGRAPRDVRLPQVGVPPLSGRVWVGN